MSICEARKCFSVVAPLIKMFITHDEALMHFAFECQGFAYLLDLIAMDTLPTPFEAAMSSKAALNSKMSSFAGNVEDPHSVAAPRQTQVQNM